jgi:hypothetical protein
LTNLKQDKRIGDDFKLAPNNYLVFLGDYVDRGCCSVETFYLLLMLKLKNPDHVILLRGNHEDSSICESYGFGPELIQKFGFSDPADRDSIYLLFDLLPVALYIHYPNMEHHSWLLACHGAPEIGFSAKDFLADKTQYARLDTIDRKKYTEELPIASDLKEKIKTAYSRISLSTVPSESSAHAFNPSAVNNALLFYVGFVWADLSEKQDFYFAEGRGPALGKEIIQALINRDGLTLIIRGHQPTWNRRAWRFI